MDNIEGNKIENNKMIKNLEDIKGKKIAIIGSGKTGISLAKFLTKYEAEVLISDHKSEAELVDNLEQIKNLPVKIELEGHTPSTLLKQDYVILSPSVSPHLNLFEHLKKQGVQLTGEFEFASRFVKEPMVVVTGTNGKTTVVDLASLFLKNSGVNVWTGGNYNLPLSEYLYSGEKASVLVLEASSYMLEHCDLIKPKHIVFTSLAQNHLDRHNKSMENYINAKKQIFKNIDKNITTILNADSNTILKKVAKDTQVQKGRIFYFSCNKNLKPQIMNIGGAITIDQEVMVRTSPEIEHYSVKNTSLRGTHSHENIMAAILIAKEYGGTWQHIQRGIDEYKGKPHRLEYVRKVGGALFFNDSKATNVHAVSRALDAFDGDRNIILIMGGKDTGMIYSPLAESIRKKVKSLILIGEAKEGINRDLGGITETFFRKDFNEAVYTAYHRSRIDDIVLLSPCCQSFDSFDSYEERGDHFKKLVRQLK